MLRLLNLLADYMMNCYDSSRQALCKELNMTEVEDADVLRKLKELPMKDILEAQGKILLVSYIVFDTNPPTTS